MRRRLSLRQHIPDGPRAAFAVSEMRPGESYWQVVFCDAASNLFPSKLFDLNSPEFRLRAPAKSKSPPPTPAAVAAAGVRHMNEAWGLISVREVVDGVCRFAAIFVSNSLHLFCIWSTDKARAKPVNTSRMAEMARRAITAARRARKARVAS